MLVSYQLLDDSQQKKINRHCIIFEKIHKDKKTGKGRMLALSCSFAFTIAALKECKR